MKYRSEIDGLRALAVAPVILFHAGFKVFSGGFVGVDVFFVISGYLITTILLNDLEAEKFSIVHFYERRARRILPALFLVMLVCLPFAWFGLLPQDMKSFSQSFVAVSVFASNILFWRTSGYFDTATELKPLIHTWSLSVEEQYYVLFPLFLFFAWRVGKRWTVGILAIVAITSLGLAQWFVYKSPSFTFYMLPTRAWELLIGAFVAFYYSEHNIKKHKYWASELGSLLGFGLIGYATFAYSDQTPFPSLYALVPTIGAALIIVFATNKTLIGKLLSTKPFLWIGLISYSAYLWHQPLFAFARHSSVESPSQLTLSALAIITLPLAYLTWRFVERPFRNKHAIPRKQVFLITIVGTALFFTIGVIGDFTNGYQSRLAIEQQDLNVFGSADIFNGSRASNGSCQREMNLPQLSEEVCLTNSREPRVLFVGDSHAMALYSSIFAQDFKLQSAIISGHSCPIYPNLSYKPTFQRSWDNNCTEISNEVLRVASEPFVKRVVLVNYYANVDDKLSRYKSAEGRALTNKEAFQSGYRSLISKILKLGKKVVFVIDVPHMRFESKKCVQSPPFNPLPQTDCRFTTEEYLQDRSRYLEEVQKLQMEFPSLAIYDPSMLFCNGINCEISRGQRSLYNDKHHISIFASKIVLEDMSRLKLLN